MFQIVFVLISLFCGGKVLNGDDIVIPGKPRQVVVFYSGASEEPQVPDAVVTYPGNGN